MLPEVPLLKIQISELEAFFSEREQIGCRQALSWHVKLRCRRQRSLFLLQLRQMPRTNQWQTLKLKATLNAKLRMAVQIYKISKKTMVITILTNVGHLLT